jgi:uncharacterized protein YegJ (DUF2314 family)
MILSNDKVVAVRRFGSVHRFLLILILSGCGGKSPASEAGLVVSPASSVSASPTGIRQPTVQDFTFDLIYSSSAQLPKPGVINTTLARTAPDIVAVASWDPESAKAEMLPEAIEAQGMDKAFLVRVGEGLSPVQSKQLTKPYTALLFHFRVPQGQNLKVVPQAERFVHELCTPQGIIGDDKGEHFCSRTAWEGRMAAWPEVTHRVRFTPDWEGVRTRGMAVFGQPELLVAGSASYTAEYRALLTVLLAQWLAEHPGEPEARLEFDPRKLGSSKVRDLWKTNCRAQPKLPVTVDIRRRGDQLVVEWESEEENNCYELLLGLKSKIYEPQDRDALTRASQKAVRELLTIWKPAYHKGLTPGESLFVKAAFRDGETTEWMWLEVKTWKDRTLTGLLLEDANLIRKFKGGQKVTVPEADLFDFLLRSETRQAGGTTDEILKAQEEQ